MARWASQRDAVWKKLNGVLYKLLKMCCEVLGETRKLNPLGMETEEAMTAMWLVVSQELLLQQGSWHGVEIIPLFRQRAGGEACIRQQPRQREVEEILPYHLCLLDY